MTETMTEILFYQLLQRSLETVLPNLVERSIKKGWNVIIQCGSEERLKNLDDWLWTFSDDSFLAHGIASQNDAAEQPILLTLNSDNPNKAQIRFLVDNVEEPEDSSQYERIVIIFNGRFEDSLKSARNQWKRCKEKGFTVTYWAQNEQGQWIKKA